MDPKAAPTLDPKLKEAYDRVMGATVPKTPPLQMPSVDLPTTHTEPIQAAPPPANINPPTANATPATAAHPPVHPSSGFVAAHEEKKSPVSGTLLVIAGVVFLLVYTLFWLKWFGIPLPFLP